MHLATTMACDVRPCFMTQVLHQLQIVAAKCVTEHELDGKVERIKDKLVLQMHPTPMALV